MRKVFFTALLWSLNVYGVEAAPVDCFTTHTPWGTSKTICNDGSSETDMRWTDGRDRTHEDEYNGDHDTDEDR